MKNKKGSIAGQKSIFYIIVGILLAILFLLFLVIAISDKIFESKIPTGLEEFIFTQRFLNSFECFAYEDSEFTANKANIIDW